MTEETDNALLKDVSDKIPANVVRIRGETWNIREIWHSVQHPDGPPVVVVQRPSKQTGGNR